MLHDLYNTALFIALMWSGEPRPVYPSTGRSLGRAVGRPFGRSLGGNDRTAR
jgi:hypothetical protein